MTRRDALFRLHKFLVARSVALQEALAGELEDLGSFKAMDATGDSADAAFDTGSEEIASQVAELEARELAKIERALARLEQGRYGLCEGGSKNCHQKIPVNRLYALPYATLCINCQREVEKYPAEHDRPRRHWERILDSGAPREDQQFRLVGLEMALPRNH
jgi:DnaK suppressor protein